ncbi:MAG TPA: hypothetical protein VKV73_30185 [Chloroflexota bacterium]|nr:hypothetical protein [Chloroflexota bacterium]
MPAFALDSFERQAEAYLRARTWREWNFLSGQRPGRGLITLYDQDFPSFTSTDLWADLQAAASEDPRQHRALSSLLAAANLEGRTRDFAVKVAGVQARATIPFEDRDIPWREAPGRWALLPEVPRRHELEESWRGVFRSELNPVLERWQEDLRTQLTPLGSDDWLTFWSAMRGYELPQVAGLAENLLRTTAELYGDGLGVYLAQLNLPIDDARTSDLDWAFRAPRFDGVFPDRNRIPALIRTLRDLDVELEEQPSIRLEHGPLPGVHVVATDLPSEVHVVLRLAGGWQDYARSLRGVGMAQHLVHTDPSLHVWERWLGDETPTLGYGLLVESLVHDRTWLASRIEYTASDDFRAITHLAWLYRVRRVAATALFEQRLWQAEPGTSMATDYEESLSAAVRSRQFSEEYLRLLLGAPWTTLRASTLVRAEVFAAQLRAYLRREYDEEWWRSGRAASFIKDELWRPGRRHSAEEILGFMGYVEGFDPATLTAEFEEVLRPL